MISAMEKNEEWEGRGSSQEARKGHPVKVTFEQSPKGTEGASHASIWRKSVRADGSSMCKGPEARRVFET